MYNSTLWSKPHSKMCPNTVRFLLVVQETDQIVVVIGEGWGSQSRGRGGHCTESTWLFCSVAVNTENPVNKQTLLLQWLYKWFMLRHPMLWEGMCSPVKGVNFISGQGVRHTWIAFWWVFNWKGGSMNVPGICFVLIINNKPNSVRGQAKIIVQLNKLCKKIMNQPYLVLL